MGVCIGIIMGLGFRVHYRGMYANYIGIIIRIHSPTLPCQNVKGVLTQLSLFAYQKTPTNS